jgi:Dyp-type peroxidase family
MTDKKDPARDLKNEPPLAMGSIQADLLLNHSKKFEAQIYFKITDPKLFKPYIRLLPFTSAAEVYRPHGENEAVATGEIPPDTRYSCAFSFSGLKALQVKDVDKLATDQRVEPFVQGLGKRAVAELNDSDPSTWLVGKPNEPVDGVFIITTVTEQQLQAALLKHFGIPALAGYKTVETFRGNVRTGHDSQGRENEGREHFGFMDGVSQPALRGCVDALQTVPLSVTSGEEGDQALPGQDLLWPGEFVFGYPGQNAHAPKFNVKGDPQPLPLPWMVNGSFLVIRRLRQFVPEMHAAMREQAQKVGLKPETLEAQLVGRFPGGAPILKSNTDDIALGADETRNNDFEFKDDRGGVTCPWSAHIRKTYPRDETPGNAPGADADAAEAFTQSHRLLRRGIQFGPELNPTETKTGKTSEQRGLLFRCYQTDLADQFEFVQKSWANNPNFSQKETGIDIIIGQAANGGVRNALGAGDLPNKPKLSFEPFVTMTGGEYFFAPSIDFLSGLR